MICRVQMMDTAIAILKKSQSAGDRSVLGRLFSFGFELVEFLEVPIRIGFKPGQALSAAEAHGPVRLAIHFVNIGHDLAGH